MHLLAPLLILLMACCHALGQIEVFPNATPPGTSVEIRGLHIDTNDIMVTLNDISMPVLGIYDDYLVVEVPDTWSGWPEIFFDDTSIGESDNQLYVIQPVFFQPWVPTPLLSEDASIAGLLLPGDTDTVVMELNAGDNVAMDLVALSYFWYPYTHVDLCRMRAYIWPIGIEVSSTTFAGPTFWQAPETGIYVIYIQQLCAVTTPYLSTFKVY